MSGMSGEQKGGQSHSHGVNRGKVAADKGQMGSQMFSHGELAGIS